MGSITIRNVDDAVKERLRVASAQAGHSMEEHVRRLIEREVGAGMPPNGFGTWLHEQFRGIDSSDLTIADRSELAEPIDLPR